MGARSFRTLAGCLCYVALWGCASEDQGANDLPTRATATSIKINAPVALPDPTNCDELKHWMMANGSTLTSTKVTSEGRFEIRFRPAALAACEALERQPEPKPTLDSMMLEYSGGLLFQVDLVKNGRSSGFGPALFAESGIKRFMLVTGSDTTTCAFIHPILTPESKSWSTALIGFDRAVPDSSFQVLIDMDNSTSAPLIFPFASGMNDHFSAMHRVQKTPRS